MKPHLHLIRVTPPYSFHGVLVVDKVCPECGYVQAVAVPQQPQQTRFVMKEARS